MPRALWAGDMVVPGKHAGSSGVHPGIRVASELHIKWCCISLECSTLRIGLSRGGTVPSLAYRRSRKGLVAAGASNRPGERSMV